MHAVRRLGIFNGMTRPLDTFSPISLDQMSGIKLMNRTDTKFVTNTTMLDKLLDMAENDYYVQCIDGNRLANYYTLYFDTPECDMFRTHHNGSLNRQKLRIRSYVDSRQSFLEVKTKNNHGRTNKKRVAIGAFDPTAPDYSIPGFYNGRTDFKEFLGQNLRYDSNSMTSQVENHFTRITLVNKGKTERLTIDTGLEFLNVTNGNSISLDGLVIIELKRDGLAYSPVLEMLRSLRIKPMGFSKYCMAQALTNKKLKQNRFKMRLHDISNILETR